MLRAKPWGESIASPIAVRHAWEMNPNCNLINHEHGSARIPHVHGDADGDVGAPNAEDFARIIHEKRE